MGAAELHFRVATTADIPSLMDLIERSVRELQKDDYTPTQIDASIGSAFGIDRQLLEDSTYFLATQATAPECIVACGGWSFRRTLCGSDAIDDDSSPRDTGMLDPAEDFAKIRAIFVHPAFARRGIGSRMLAHCEDAARQAGFTRFEMGSTVTGVRLYQLRGYIERERINLRLPNGEPLAVVVMSKG